MLNIKNGEMNKAYKIKRMDIANENMLYRLSAFGLTDDAIITIKQKCLSKGPCIIEVNGQQLSIRHCDACSIALEE
ncbi:TPA: ferrous iron transport protein A [Staphylococcus aureus]|uniref:FeoA family protein n=1 Tax=Staphylococcus aureus TaxID=1280 RepID=UPI00091E7C18|nr:ferrous iron transport protein A [Staphylococcus aureus]MEB6819529.1 ferrous iron transport protein A [Staphylococcus aureus]SGU58231.1 feoA domain protein [Staphylococcus aureus]HCY6187273.1 ferrous iron transport protein A [Staphylococcus aureus]HDC7790633.1 ferrous iron transport protein A [Staphylococcus aureus]HDI7673939.1 ferrous iron transport protein A [Staphylococcus aureus]